MLPLGSLFSEPLCASLPLHKCLLEQPRGLAIVPTARCPYCHCKEMHREKGFYRCSNPQAAGSCGGQKLFHTLQEADVFRSCRIACVAAAIISCSCRQTCVQVDGPHHFCACTMSLSVFFWVVLAVWSYLLCCGNVERLILKAHSQGNLLL